MQEEVRVRTNGLIRPSRVECVRTGFEAGDVTLGTAELRKPLFAAEEAGIAPATLRRNRQRPRVENEPVLGEFADLGHGIGIEPVLVALEDGQRLRGDRLRRDAHVVRQRFDGLGFDVRSGGLPAEAADCRLGTARIGLAMSPTGNAILIPIVRIFPRED